MTRPHTQVANIRRETQGRKARLKRIRVKDTVAHIVTDGSRAADGNRKDPSSVAGSGHRGASADGLHSQLEKDPLRAASVDTGPAFRSAGDRADPVSGAVRSFPSASVEAQGAEPNRTPPTVVPADMGLAPWNATTPEGCVRQSLEYTACTSIIMCARRGTCPAASVAMQWLCVVAAPWEGRHALSQSERQLPNLSAKILTARPLQEACCGRGRRKARLARVRGVCDGL